MMRKAASQANRRRRVSSATKPAPVLGWNARDAIASMKDGYAVILDNWWPNASTVDLRKGSANHVTGIGSPTEVETLAAYRPKTSTQKLFAWAGTSAYDASVAGAVGAAVLSALTNARWQCQNYASSSGHFLLCVNGADDMRVYNGAAWSTVNAGTVPAITGVLTANLNNVFVHAERPFYVEKDSLNLWYPAAAAFTGALTSFPLDGVFKNGGYIVGGGSWSVDSGNGMTSLLVVVTSEGEVAVYSGTNPASFVKVGVYAIGKPIGTRCVLQYGSDLLIITTDGLIPISKVIGNGNTDKAIALTDTIQTAMASAAGLYKSRFGWQASFYPDGSMLLLNIPIGSGLQIQFAMNTITKAWTRFTPQGTSPGWPANCFEVFGGELYFGGKGFVRKAWTGTADVGIAIESDMLTAFSAFSSAQEKHFLRISPVIGWDSNPAQILIGIDTDFITGAPTSSIALATSTGGTFDTGTWDASQWAGNITTNKDWFGAEGTGVTGAMHMKAKSANAQIKLSAIRYEFEIAA